MNADDITLLAEQLAPRIAAAVLDDPRFRDLVREAALSVAAEQDKLRRDGVPRAWLASCRLAGLGVRLAGTQVRVTGRLSEPLRAVLDLYRPEITDYLRDFPAAAFRPPPTGEREIAAARLAAEANGITNPKGIR